MQKDDVKFQLFLSSTQHRVVTFTLWLSYNQKRTFGSLHRKLDDPPTANPIVVIKTKTPILARNQVLIVLKVASHFIEISWLVISTNFNSD